MTVKDIQWFFFSKKNLFLNSINNYFRNSRVYHKLVLFFWMHCIEILWYWMKKCLFLQFIHRKLEEHFLFLHRLDSRVTYGWSHRLVASVGMFIRQFLPTLLNRNIWLKHMLPILVQVWRVHILPGMFTFAYQNKAQVLHSSDILYKNILKNNWCSY